MADMWLVGRCGPDHLNGARAKQMTTWLLQLGLDLTVLAQRAAVVYRGGRFELHLSEYVLTEQGRKLKDIATDQPVTRPLIVEVAENSWPDWLTGLDNQPAPAGRTVRGLIVAPAAATSRELVFQAPP